MDLLVEIGTEELPAKVINPLLEYLKEALSHVLGRKDAKTYGTPRRIALYYKNFENLSSTPEELLIGPPLSIAYDNERKPTRALLGFLQRTQTSEKDLITLQKGTAQYVAVKKVQEGKKPLDLLVAQFEGILLSAPLPKSMRWGKTYVKFSRPVRWICALYGEQVVPLRFGSVQAGRKTRGHRFLSQGWIELRSASEYEEKLKEHYVIPDFKERLGMILSFLKEESYTLGGVAEYPEGLDEEVANLVEFPFAVVGAFDEKYLQLPQKVIVTVLAHHQRFFCVKKRDELLPDFIAISGNLPKDSLIVKGYEKVVKARLEDALFFYREDLKVRLEDLVKELSQVVFHPKAGSMLEKTQRLITLSEEIGKALNLDENTLKKLRRASYLSKADILTHMVREFDELQGYMGYVYALLQGEDQETALAIYEHYLPSSSSDPLPSGLVGKALSLADKVDNLVILIRVGEVPSGSSDPYGLRRYAHGVFSIIEDTQWDLDLRELIKKTYGGVDKTWEEFLRSRLEAYLEPYGYDVARAVLEVHDPPRPLESINVAKRIASLKEEQKFKDVVSTYRRVVKILPKDWEDSMVDEMALREKEEKDLWEKLKGLRVEDILDLQPLKEYIDNFFDKVLVMDKDEQVRRNRLALLLNVKQLFNKFADFGKLVYEEV